MTQLCKDNRCWFICDDTLFFVQDKVTKEILYKGRSRLGILFQIPVSLFQHARAFLGWLVKSSVWHQRLGHPTNEVKSVILAKSQVSHSLDDTYRICSNCINGKMSKSPFPVEANRCLLPFDRIHTDV